MNIYVIQVFSQNEERFMSLTMKALKSAGLNESEKDKFFQPRRTLEIRRKGIKSFRTDALYPGYIFYNSPEVETEIYRIIKRVPGFIRFLKNNHNIEPLSKEDEEVVRHFISFGESADTSKVYFDENNMIQIVSGPMKGLEGRIVKVDRRKKRAKILLNLYKESFPIDLGFEVIVPAEKSDEADKA